MLQTGCPIEGGCRHTRRHQIPRREVIEKEHLGDHRGLIGFDLALLRSEFRQQADLLLISADFVFLGDGWQQTFQQQHEWAHHHAEPVQHWSTRQGDRQGHTAANRLGQDLAQQNHQHREADGEERQGKASRIHPFSEDNGGIATQHQASKDVEAVVGDHQHGERPSQALAKLSQSAGSGDRPGAGRQFMHAHGIHREQCRFNA